MLIVDEAQTLESERGHLLELLLLKLRALNPQIQVVFLSATLPNPRAIARWLDAALYLYAERMQRDPPSQRVTEYAVVNGEVRSRDGAILRRLGVSDRTGALRELVRELLAQADASTVLVFCPTKSRCEKVVRLLLPLMVSSPPPPHPQPPLSPEHQQYVEAHLLLFARTHATRLDPAFARFLRAGVIYHHAGLTDEERLLAEGLFRRGCVRVLAATTTLSAGVNLNVAVVVLDGIRRGKQSYTRTEYQQMVGRTGRMGQTAAGRVFVLLDAADAAAYQRLAQREARDVSQTQDGAAEAESRRFLRSGDYWRKAVLELVGCGVARGALAVLQRLADQSFFGFLLGRPALRVGDFVSLRVEPGPPEQYVVALAPSLLAADGELALSPSLQPAALKPATSAEQSVQSAQSLSESQQSAQQSVQQSQQSAKHTQHSPPDPLLLEIVSALRFLLEGGFLVLTLPVAAEASAVQAAGTAAQQLALTLTALGEAAFRSGLSATDVQQLAASLARLNENLDISNHLQVLFHLTPLAVDVRVDIAAVLQYTESQLADAELQFINRDVLPLGTLYSLRNGRSVEVGDGRGGDG